MKNAVIICCDNNYIPRAIVALKQFSSYNPDYHEFIIGTCFDSNMKELCNKYNIKFIEINLKNDFKNLDKRPYGKEYPIECFYHFYAYKLLNDFDYILCIEPDIYTNKQLDIDFEKIKYIGGSYISTELISKYPPLMKFYEKFKEKYKICHINQFRILGGVKIYNVKGLEEIDFYKTIVDYYNESWNIGSPRCGDDSLCVMYQMLNPTKIKLLEQEFHVIHSDQFKNYQKITFFHFGGNTPKYWKIKGDIKLKPIILHFYKCMKEFIMNKFSQDFIKKFNLI